jgi:endonuclease YncB( thermonuclease family)
MMKLFSLILLILFMGCDNSSISPVVQLHTDTTFFDVKYVKNYDADTITVDIVGVHPLLGKGANIRVNGIDTPEMRGGTDCEKALAKEAKLYVATLLVGADRIRLDNVSRGKYFRIVADVIVTSGDNVVSIGEELIDMRYAVFYDGGTKTLVDWCTMGGNE